MHRRCGECSPHVPCRVWQRVSLHVVWPKHKDKRTRKVNTEELYRAKCSGVLELACSYAIIPVASVIVVHSKHMANNCSLLIISYVCLGVWQHACISCTHSLHYQHHQPRPQSAAPPPPHKSPDQTRPDKAGIVLGSQGINVSISCHVMK